MTNFNIINAQVCNPSSWSEEELENFPTVTIFVNFHFVPSEDNGGTTYTDDPTGSTGSGQWFAQALVDGFNDKMANIPQNAFNGPGGVPADPFPGGDSHLRMAFYNNSIEESLHFYELGESPASIHGNAVLDVFVIDAPETINGVSVPCPSRKGNTLEPGTVTWLNLKNFHCNNVNPSDLISLHTFAHEVGHTLGLEHSHCCDQKAFDIDPIAECNEPDCDCDADDCSGVNGNNLMGDNAIGFALTPGQVLVMYDHLLQTEFTNFKIGDCEKTEPPFYVSSPTPVVWNGVRFFNSDVIVQTGTVLTITCGIYMAHKAKIRVQRGARLIIKESGMITSICEDKEWGGINVHGNAAVAHTDLMKDVTTPLLATDPGVLNLENAELKNAGTAVSTKRCCVPWAQQIESRGGLIVANGARFINNRRAVEFLKYDHPNKSSFTTCEFFGNRGTRGVTIWDCEGIVFDKCVFEDLGDVNDVGILAINSAIIIQDKCRFDDLNIAIDCSNTAPFSTGEEIRVVRGSSQLDRNVFNRNRSHDIRAVGLDQLTLIGNDFNDQKASFRDGVFVDEETRFTTNDNAFFETGIRLRFNGTRDNFIFNNSFSNISGGIRAGIFVTGVNEETIFDRNCFDNPKFDVHLLSNDDLSPSLKVNLGSLNAPLYNSFSHDNDAHEAILDFDVSNFSPFHIYYYHKEAETGNPSLIPRCEDMSNSPDCTVTHNFEAVETAFPPLPEDFEKNCLILDLSPPDDPQCITLDCLEDIKNSVNNKRSLLDGGDTDGLLSALEYTPQSSGTLQQLNDASPYLTDGVLEALIMSSIAEADKETILMANAPLRPPVMAVAQQNLTANTIANLESVQTTKPYADRLILDLEISDLRLEYQRTINTRLLELSETDSNAEIEATLLFDNTDDSRRRLFGFYLRTGDFIKAQTALNNLPETTEEEQIFKEIQTINLAFESATESFVLNPIQDSILTELAHQDKRYTGFARSLLLLLKDELILLEEDFDIPNEQIKAPDNTALKQNPQPAKLTLHPNPADASVQINIPANLTLSTDSEVRVLDNSGKIVLRKILEEQIRQIEIHSGDLPVGFYTVCLWSHGKLKAYNKLVILR